VHDRYVHEKAPDDEELEIALEGDPVCEGACDKRRVMIANISWKMKCARAGI